MTLLVRQLGTQPYQPVWEAMQRFTQTRTASTPDEIWCLQHAPVFTLGQAGKTEHLLNPGDIPVIKVDRGGQVTYHGPGQLVCYLLIDLRRHNIGARQFVTHIEESLIRVLRSYQVEAISRPDAPGVYVDNAKIAALGLRIRRGCSFHGLSLNINMDL
ncbi:MAG: lipoyl(octanoyl) transferase LipB, partial [Gammaproteobacteria bacterium]|nr:lipoyl(octanoyl) transferase LipB [Gammaproteobacteria bacterium]